MTNITEQTKAAEKSDGKCSLAPHQIIATTKKTTVWEISDFSKTHGGD
ncbi:MAG: hypothetical protein WC046_08835 [Candidatus Bathyarchaeia archaeon]